mmetsp:Transcript_16938/g.23969  ORF Transcript_16938/g.23969 Transcript_16938/m.23969 type:complete len:94 (+) Transcript_16938:544-825(+)
MFAIRCILFVDEIFNIVKMQKSNDDVHSGLVRILFKYRLIMFDDFKTWYRLILTSVHIVVMSVSLSYLSLESIIMCDELIDDKLRSPFISGNI